MEQNSNKLFTSSIGFDKRLYNQDINGSIAHVQMLGNQGILTDEEAKLIQKGLEKIRSEIKNGTFRFSEEYEDIHINIEKGLFEKIGGVAGKLHTGRSRNDQVALDIRMFVKESTLEVWGDLFDLRKAIISKAQDNIEVYLPGYTHLQRGQPVSLAHHLLAYYEMFTRDGVRFSRVYEYADVMPLGSGALAGTTYSLDREWVAKKLGFKNISTNSMDAVSDRDFLLDFHSASAICAVHISRLCEEIVIWTSEEFGFAKLGEGYTSGSSMMPQKRNPDFAEIGRAKTGRVFGNLVAMLTILKGLPLTYNRDLQEDKEPLFDSIDTILKTLRVIKSMLETLTFNKDKMRSAIENSNTLATDIADYLVGKGIPFREAHGIVNKLTDYSLETNQSIHELSLETYKKFSNLFEIDVTNINIENSINSRDGFGGTALKRVQESIITANGKLKDETEIGIGN